MNPGSLSNVTVTLTWNGTNWFGSHPIGPTRSYDFTFECHPFQGLGKYRLYMTCNSNGVDCPPTINGRPSQVGATCNPVFAAWTGWVVVPQFCPALECCGGTMDITVMET